MSFHTWMRVLKIASVVLLVLVLVGVFIPEAYHPLYEILLAFLFVPVVIADFKYFRCPHCDSYIRHSPQYLFLDKYCRHCGGYLFDKQPEWSEDYEGLNYLQGELNVFENYAQTMFTVTYTDGMCIHVGYDETENEYVITVMKDESEAAKDSPLAVHRVFGHNALLETLQKTVHTWRDDKIEY